MTREPITETVVEQLHEVVESGQVTDPVARYDVQALAHRRGLTDLATFIVDADASTYYEALMTATDGDPPEPKRRDA
jgi:predicted short-subunit dehydrogenase-like oxidoreductase (DUF2520 family)